MLRTSLQILFWCGFKRTLLGCFNKCSDISYEYIYSHICTGMTLHSNSSAGSDRVSKSATGGIVVWFCKAALSYPLRRDISIK